tara:strand:+ start:307 stop:1686 length:1380 start_codon:yes stop_codon:yes gene_type:complete
MPFKSEKQRRYMFANEPEIAKKWSKEYNMGGVASMFRKKQADGTDPNYEGWKKIYETNPDLAALNDKHDEYLEKYTLEMSTSDSGEAGILGTDEANMEFVENDDGEEVMVDDRINLMAAAPEKQPFLSGDLSATTLFMSKGGRIRFAGGGKDAGKDSDFGSENYGGGGGDDRPTMADIAGPVTSSFTDADDNRDNYKTTQYTTGPKTRTKTIDSPKLNKITGKKVPTYTIQTPFSPKTKTKTGFGPKGKDTWHKAAVKNINKNIKDVDRTLNPSKFNLLDIVLTIGSLGLINPAVTKVAKSISNVKTAFNVANLVSKKTKTKGVKETVKDVLTNTAKKEISKKTGIDVKTIDTTIDTIQKALDTKLGKAVVDKFNSFNTTNKNTTKTTTFNGGDNDGSNNAIVPVVPELITEEVIVKEPTSSLSDMATLDLIRNRQNTRRSFFNANSGGLAGLFKVKKQ